MNKAAPYETRFVEQVCQGAIYRDVSYIVECLDKDEIIRYIEKYAVVISHDLPPNIVPALE